MHVVYGMCKLINDFYPFVLRSGHYCSYTGPEFLFTVFHNHPLTATIGEAVVYPPHAHMVTRTSQALDLSLRKLDGRSNDLLAHTSLLPDCRSLCNGPQNFLLPAICCGRWRRI